MKTVAVVIVSAAVSAVVVASAGFYLVNQAPAKRTVYQTAYASSTPTPAFFPTPTFTPTPTLMPTPKPTKAPLIKLSEQEEAAVADLLQRTSAYLEYYRNYLTENGFKSDPVEWPFQIDSLKSSFTNSSIRISYTLTKGIPIDPSLPNGYGLFKLTATCFVKRDPDVISYGSPSDEPYTVTYDQYNGLAAEYPFSPSEWVVTRTVKGITASSGGYFVEWAYDNYFWKEVLPCAFYQSSY